MKRSLLLFLVSGLLLIAAQAQAAGKLVNGIDANFPPFAFIDKTGQPSGFDVEVMDWIAKDLGMEVTHQAIAQVQRAAGDTAQRGAQGDARAGAFQPLASSGQGGGR